MNRSLETPVPVSDRSTEGPGLNRRAGELVDHLLRDAGLLRVKPQRLGNGTRVIDAGIECSGGLEAGRLIAEVCLGGAGTVSLAGSGPAPGWPLSLQVHTVDPVRACLGSQYAGWSLSHGEGKGAFHALGSGPARALARRETLFGELDADFDMAEDADSACLVLEVDQLPPVELVQRIVADCGIEPDALTLILTPTRSLAGTVQVVARVLEVALHKAHELGFPLRQIIDGAGSAPLPPPAPDFLNAMGRTNDAILFGGNVVLYVDADDDQAAELCRALPSSASRDYGRPFAEVFKSYNYDFFEVDPMLFSPARVTVCSLTTGNSFQAGALDAGLLAASFGACVATGVVTGAGSD